MPNPSSTFRVDTPDGFVLVDASVRITPGDLVAFQWEGYPMMGKVYSKSLVTADGEVIEGEALEGVIVLGKITFQVLSVHEGDGPV